MAKLAPTSIKYIIKAHIRANGIVEKPDVIGAVFGQTEGLLGPELDLRELQKTGRIGRIEVKIKSSQGKSEGEIIIPSSLDSAETALIAATLETIERIGPCDATIELKSVEDARAIKREYAIDRAKDILRNYMNKGVPDLSEISDKIREEVKAFEVTNYKGLPCGPNIMDSDEIILVEGRADVVNLLKHNIKNAIAIGGTSIPDTIVNLTKEKITTLFIDGDRGGKLIAKEILQRADVDYIVSAPEGKEVEELTKKEIYKALRDKITAEQFKLEEKITTVKKEGRTSQKGRSKASIRLSPEQKKLFVNTLEDLVGTRAACIFDENNDLLGKVPVKELANTLKTIENPHTIIFDGRVDRKLAMLAKQRRVKFLVGMEKDSVYFPPLKILSKADLE
jgi:DNA primase